MLAKNIKKITILGLFLISLVSSCNNKSLDINDIKSKDDFLITEHFVDKEDILNEILEISILSRNNIEYLKDYKLEIYNRSSLIYTFEFSSIYEEIINNSLIDSILFINKDATYQVDTLSNIKVINLSDNFIIKKYFYSLSYKNIILDTLGNKEIDIAFNNGGSLVRLKEYFIARGKFNELDYIRVSSNFNKYLGNINSPLTLNELLEGPHIEKKYLEYSFVSSENKDNGGGGLLEVSSFSLGDGDTTYFRFNSSELKNKSTRYLLIDTPEIDHGPNSSIVAEPFGKEAKRFNNNKLNGAKKILVQSNKDSSLYETYSRLLGYVFYSDVSNPSLEDYKLLNFELVKNGLARISLYNEYSNMSYKDVSYFDYIYYVYTIARNAKIKIHGEIDEEFDYS